MKAATFCAPTSGLGGECRLPATIAPECHVLCQRCDKLVHIAGRALCYELVRETLLLLSIRVKAWPVRLDVLPRSPGDQPAVRLRTCRRCLQISAKSYTNTS
jgi:hypothetical protein